MRLEREIEMGTPDGGQSIKASGRAGRINRPDTNPHPIAFQKVYSALDPQRASTQSLRATLKAAPA
jgi:hypothetical protein